MSNALTKAVGALEVQGGVEVERGLSEVEGYARHRRAALSALSEINP